MKMNIKGLKDIRTMQDSFKSRSYSTPKHQTPTRAELFERYLKIRDQLYSDYMELNSNWLEIEKRQQKFSDTVRNEIKKVISEGQ